MNKIILIYGLPSIGKTTLCNRISETYPAHKIVIDDFWKKVIATPKYTIEESKIVFNAFFHEYKKAIIEKQNLIIIEGVFASKERIELLKEVVNKEKYKFYSILLFDNILNILEKNEKRYIKEGKLISAESLKKLHYKFNSSACASFSFNMEYSTIESIYNQLITEKIFINNGI